MPDPKTYTQDEVDALVAERVADDAGSLKRALEAEREEKKAAKADARTLKAALTELEQAQKASKAGVTSQELDRLRAEVKADLDKQYAPFRESAETLAAENRRLKLDGVVKGEMAKHGARAERIEALFKLTAGEYDLTDDGKPMLRDRPGTPVEKFITGELQEQYPEFFTGTGSTGGGASKSAAGGGNGKTIASGDGRAFIANLAEIAKGTVNVR